MPQCARFTAVTASHCQAGTNIYCDVGRASDRGHKTSARWQTRNIDLGYEADSVYGMRVTKTHMGAGTARSVSRGQQGQSRVWGPGLEFSGLRPRWRSPINEVTRKQPQLVIVVFRRVTL